MEKEDQENIGKENIEEESPKKLEEREKDFLQDLKFRCAKLPYLEAIQQMSEI